MSDRLSPVRRTLFRLCRLGALATLVTGEAWSVEIVAHRGASHDAPENTLPAVLLGWERGADAVEVDIHQSRDGRIVAIHDKDVLRVTGQTGVVADLDFGRLRSLDAGAWKGARWAGTSIPSLGEVLATVPDDRKLVVEIKCPADVLDELERVLDTSGKRGSAMLIAFDYDTIAKAKRRMPDVPSYWLYGFSDREAERYSVRAPGDLIRRVEVAGLDGLDVRHSGPWIADLVRSLDALGKKLYVYTVNSPAAARRLRDLGVAGITTDRPGFLREALESH